MISAVGHNPDAAVQIVSALSWKLITASVVASASYVSPFLSIDNVPAVRISPTVAVVNANAFPPAPVIPCVEASAAPFSSYN